MRLDRRNFFPKKRRKKIQSDIAMVGSKSEVCYQIQDEIFSVIRVVRLRLRIDRDVKILRSESC